MMTAWNWGNFFQSLFGIFQWTVAILSVAGTLALLSWIVLMIVKKDKAK